MTLSPFNLLVAGDRLVLIDLPQVIDVVANPDGPTFLARDVHNVCSWFSAQGLEGIDEPSIVADPPLCHRNAVSDARTAGAGP